MLIIGAIAVAAVGYVGYLFFDFKKGISTTRSIVDSDTNRLVGLVDDVDLTPWPIEDIDLLSRIGDSDLSKKLFGDIEKGVLYNIYHEPILSFACKRYNLDQSITLAVRFNEATYLITPNQPDTYQVTLANKEQLASISSDSVSISTRLNTIRIAKEDGQTLIPVSFNNKVKLMINDQDVDDSDQTRALVVKESLSKEEGELFIIILAFGLINQII